MIFVFTSGTLDLGMSKLVLLNTLQIAAWFDGLILKVTVTVVARRK